MSKLTKRMHIIQNKIHRTKPYDIHEALTLLQQSSSSSFIESVDVAINLGIDTRKSDQNVRGTVILPHSIGRNVYVVVFTQGENIKTALTAGADLVGMHELIDKIKKNKKRLDVVIASPDAMQVVGKLGQFLGPRGLMPNPKMGTITTDISTAVKNAKTSQIYYRNDKNGIIHSSIGKINFEFNKLKENLETLLLAIKKNKPTHTKGIFLKKISLSTTMGIGLIIDYNSLFTTTI